jgi:ribosomal protein L11 methyltransferase
LAATDPLTYVASIEAASPAAEAIAAALEAAEAPAVLAVALFERGAGCVEVSAHYADEPSRGRLAALIEGAAPGHDTGALKIEALAHRNWVAEAERLRGPVRAGRFVMHGRHDRGKVPAGRNTLEIDASLAFGTAHHATTRGCLIALDRILKRERPRSILDIGTGTGILAIAAARALRTRAIASDIDPVAVEVAAANIRVNGVQAWVSAVVAEGLGHPALRRGKADLLFANILLRPLLGLAPGFARAVRPGGICVLSGLLTSQARQVEARFRALGFTLESRVVLDGWAILLLRRGSGRRAAAD